MFVSVHYFLYNKKMDFTYPHRYILFVYESLMDNYLQFKFSKSMEIFCAMLLSQSKKINMNLNLSYATSLFIQLRIVQFLSTNGYVVVGACKRFLPFPSRVGVYTTTSHPACHTYAHPKCNSVDYCFIYQTQFFSFCRRMGM